MLMVVIRKIGDEWPGFMGVFFIITMGFILAAIRVWNKYSVFGFKINKIKKIVQF